MEHFYRVYGLRVVANRQLPGLMPVDHPGRVDLRIELDETGGAPFHAVPQQLWYASKKDQYGNYAHVFKLGEGAYYRFVYNDGADFVIERSGRRIWAAWPPAMSVEDVLTYLTGHILGFTLGLRGYLCLHASAVAIDGRAVALTAPGGGGKSTTAAAFATLGFPVITDDILVLQLRSDDFLVQPGYPRINLWPSSVAVIPSAGSNLPWIVPGSGVYNKRYIDLVEGWDRFQSTPLQLAAIYTGVSNSQYVKPSVRRVSARDAMVTLASQLYRFPLIERADLIKEFELLARIASRVPLRSVAFRRELHRIQQLCEIILSDFRSLQTNKAGTPAGVDEAIV